MNKTSYGQPRRSFLKTLAAAGAGALLAGGAAAQVETQRKIKLGVVGCGGRGAWIAEFFRQHGGYVMHAVADYFQEVADKCGDALGVDKARRFSTLSGYKRLLESGVEAVVLEVPPYFFPEQAAAAVDAGKHVFMAKPIASDVPGALKVLAAGQNARRRQQVFMVDYQMPTDPVNIEIVRRIRSKGFGAIAQVSTTGTAGGISDPPFTANYESRLRKLIWVNDIAAGCDYLGNYDIHAIDAALWVIGRRPLAAAGGSRICRANPHGDAHDVCSVVFDYEDGLVHNHFGQALGNFMQNDLNCRVYGAHGNAVIDYSHQASFRSSDDAHSGLVKDLYDAGPKRNIATFYKDVTEGRCENPTLERSVDGVLTCVLGREAAARRVRLTMRKLLHENKRLELDLKGLKA